MLSAVLCGCNETGTFSEKKYTPVYVYLSTTPYVGESSMSDFVDYPSDLVRLGLQGTVKEVKTTSAAEMVQKFNEEYAADGPAGSGCPWAFTGRYGTAVGEAVRGMLLFWKRCQ